MTQTFSSSNPMDLPAFLEHGCKLFIEAGMESEEVCRIVSGFVGYMIGNGAPTHHLMKSSVGIVHQIISATAEEVFLLRSEKDKGGTA